MNALIRYLFIILIFTSLFNPVSAADTTRSNGTGGGDWHTLSTWDNGLPAAGKYVILRNGDLVSVSSSDGVCGFLYIEDNGTTLNVNSNRTVTCTDIFLYSGSNSQTVNLNIAGTLFVGRYFNMSTKGFSNYSVNISGSGYFFCNSTVSPWAQGGSYELNLDVTTNFNGLLYPYSTSSTLSRINLSDSLRVNSVYLFCSTSSTNLEFNMDNTNARVNLVGAISFGSNGGVITQGTSESIFYFSSLTNYNNDSRLSYKNVAISGAHSLSSSFSPTQISGSLMIKNGATLNTNGNSVALPCNFVNNGTLTQSSGDNFTFNGSSAQTISGSSKTTFEDLIINNSNGVTISGDTVKVNGSLELLNGTLTTGGKLKLLDAGTGIAPIKTIQGTGAISGEVTAQFYLGTSGNPLTKVDYRQLAFPLSGIQISDVQYNASTCPKCFYTYGFTGSNYPGVSYTSFYKYDNTVSLSRFSDGYIAPTSTSEPLEYKQGILFNGGPGSNGQSSYFMELSGTINSGNITLSTANGAKMNSNATANFRYALVGNPYLSEITLSAGDFTSCGEGSGAMWVYEPDNGGYNTAKNTISPFQSFWVLMDASGTPSISITESDKTGSKASTLKSQSANNNQLIVKLKQTNSKTNLNYAAIRFNDQATNNMDYGYDVSDFQNPYPLPDISFVSEDDELLSTYVTSNDIDHVKIPIRTSTHFSGQHSITVDNLDQFDGCYLLEDKFENKLISLTNTNNSYDFFLADTTKGIRFVLHKYNMVKKLETTNSTCFGDDNGSAELTLVNHGGTAPDKVQWLTSNGSLILDDYQAKGRSALNNLKAGNYSIAFESGNLNCAASKTFAIFEPGEMAPAFTLANSRNDVNQNEEIKFNNTSTGDILTYTWDFGDGFTSSETAPTHSFNQVGIFEVKLTASNGNSDCNVSSTSTVKVIERETTLGLEEVLSNAGFNYVVANDILRLTFTEDISQDTPLKIINLQGQELMNHEILKGFNSYQMDISSLPAVFILQFDGESSYKSIKIAK